MEDKFTKQEEQLRALTEDFSLDLDTSELWGSIEGQLPPVQTERRRPVFWWFASSILLAVIGLLSWHNYSLSHQLDQLAAQPLQVENNTPVHTLNSQSKHTSNSLEPNFENPTIKESNSIEASNTEYTIHEPRPLHNISKVNTPAIFNTFSYDERSQSSKAEVIDQSIENSSKTNQALVNPSLSHSILESTVLNTDNRDMVYAKFLPSGVLNPLEYNSEFLSPTLTIEPVRVAEWLPYFAFYSGVNAHKGMISANGAEAFNMAQFENEKSLLGISSMLQYGYENSKGWRIGLGASHNKLVSRFSQNESITTTEEIDGISTSKIDGQGNVLSLNGTLNQTVSTEYDINWHRTHDFLNLQLNVGKKLLQKGGLVLYADASLSRNIWSNHTGYYYQEGKPSITKFTNEKTNPYANAGYEAGVSLDLEFKLNAFAISLRPFANMGLNSITQNSNYYQLKNSHYGIQLGLVFRP